MMTTTTTMGAATTATVAIAAPLAGQETQDAEAEWRTASAPIGGAQAGNLHQEGVE
jgi:hypothetical protein